MYLSPKREHTKFTPAQLKARRKRVGVETIQDRIDDIVEQMKKDMRAKKK